MKYLTWKLNWNDDYGTGPEGLVGQNRAHLAASMWVVPDVETGTILGYLTGDVDLTILSDFDAQELSEADALAFAAAIDANAYVMEDGSIGTTTVLEVE